MTYRKEGVEAILNAFKPKSVLCPEYGMLFQHQAYIHPNMQRWYLFVGVRLPDPKDLTYDYRDKCYRVSKSFEKVQTGCRIHHSTTCQGHQEM